MKSVKQQREAALNHDRSPASDPAPPNTSSSSDVGQAHPSTRRRACEGPHSKTWIFESYTTHHLASKDLASKASIVHNDRSPPVSCSQLSPIQNTSPTSNPTTETQLSNEKAPVKHAFKHSHNPRRHSPLHNIPSIIHLCLRNPTRDQTETREDCVENYG